MVPRAQSPAPQLGASSSASNDLVLAKYLDNGTTCAFQWSQVAGGTATDQSVGVSGQNMYAVGTTRTIATFGSTTLPSPVGSNLNVLARALDNTPTPLPVQFVAFAAAPAGPAAVRLA